MKSSSPIVTLATLVALGAVTVAAAQPGAELRPGRYVQADKTCAQATPESVQTFDGAALTSPATPSCKIEVVTNHDGWHTVHKRCGQGAITSQGMRVTGDDQFVLTDTQSHPAGKFAPVTRSTHYRLCAAG